MPRSELAELDHELVRLGLTRSDFLRRCLRYGLRHTDIVLGADHQEVAAQAS
jgi:hypothetical protein